MGYKNELKDILQDLYMGTKELAFPKRGPLADAYTAIEALLSQHSKKRELEAIERYRIRLDSANNAHLWGDYGFSGREAWSGVNAILDDMKKEADKLTNGEGK